jgi:hypothetical protein
MTIVVEPDPLDSESVDQPPPPVGLSEVPTRPRHVDRTDMVDAGVAFAVALTLACTARVVLDWQGLMSTGLWTYILFLVA